VAQIEPNPISANRTTGPPGVKNRAQPRREAMQCKEHVDVVKTPRFHFTFVATLLPASPKNKKKGSAPGSDPNHPVFS
jgi:hypothetical protein